MRTWQLAGSFDAGHIRGGTPGWEREIDFHQLEATGHAAQLETDYRLFRDAFGLKLFRDGAWLAKSMPGADSYDWSYLDRLAAVSQGQITLTLCHYEWPRWLDESDLWNGRIVDLMSAFARETAARYRGHFASYVPMVESGYWTAMMTDWARWWPARPGEPTKNWWEMYSIVGRMLTGMARAIREGDADAAIGLNEPWAWHPHVSLQDQARPFYTLLGRPDPTAARETGTDAWGGAEDLLQIIGLNFYNNWGVDQGWPLAALLLEARRQFPEKRIIMGETGNCHFPERYTVVDWLHLLDEQIEIANRLGARVEAVTWAPILTLADFDWGMPAPGAWVTWDANDPARRRAWESDVAKAVRQFTE